MMISRFCGPLGLTCPGDKGFKATPSVHRTRRVSESEVWRVPCYRCEFLAGLTECQRPPILVSQNAGGPSKVKLVNVSRRCFYILYSTRFRRFAYRGTVSDYSRVLHKGVYRQSLSLHFASNCYGLPGSGDIIVLWYCDQNLPACILGPENFSFRQ